MDLYWTERAERVVQEGELEADKLINRMETVYKNTYSDIQKEIDAFHGRFAKKNNLSMEDVDKKLSPSELKSAKEEIKRYYDMAKPEEIGPQMSKKYREELRLQSAKAYMSRLEELKLNIQDKVIHLGGKENKDFTETLSKVYKNTYDKTSFNTDVYKGFATDFYGFNEKKLNKALKEHWLDENFSDRIWKDKNKLLNQLETTFLQDVAQGRSSEVIARDIASNYGTSMYVCRRLARTEAGHIMGQATLQSYDDNKVVEYEFIATLDNRTSVVCQQLDGKKFKVKDAKEGINYPEMHPNCRSTTGPSFDEDEIDKMFETAQRVARDNDGNLYYVPADTKYSEWKKMKEGKKTTLKKIKPTVTKISSETPKVNAVDKSNKNESIQERFGNEFADFMTESTDYWNKYSKPTIGANLKKELKKELIDVPDDDVEFKKYVNNIINNVDSYINDKDTMFVRHNSLDVLLKNWDDFSKDPRLKTQFETGTSKGALDPDCRNSWEKSLNPNSDKYYKFDKENALGVNKKYRPVYGEVIDKNNIHSTTATSYGDCEFILNKDTVKNRTSFTLGNSSGRMASFQKSFSKCLKQRNKQDNVAEQLSRVRFFFNNFGTNDASRRCNYGYIECQTWGGVDLSKGDVSEIIIPRKYIGEKHFDEFQELMKSYDVKITFKN